MRPGGFSATTIIMHPFFGMLLIVAAGFIYMKFGAPLAAAQRERAAAIPDETQLRRQASAARALLTVFLLLLSAALLLMTGAGWAVGGGAFLLLWALWSPWAPLRILAALALFAAGALAAVAALFIAAGGPDSRGERLPAAGVFVGGALLALLAVSGALVWAEIGLRRLGKD